MPTLIGYTNAFFTCQDLNNLGAVLKLYEVFHVLQTAYKLNLKL